MITYLQRQKYHNEIRSLIVNAKIKAAQKDAFQVLKVNPWTLSVLCLAKLSVKIEQD